jgi:glycosyltransferase involved in cell wall biosynthesis
MVAHEGFARDKSVVIPFGIDVQRIVEQAHGNRDDVRVELGLPRDAVLLVTPARLEQVKGHETLLACLPLVLAHHPNTYLLLAGSGSREQPLREQVRRLDIAERVVFLGQRADVPRLLAQAALCILPSYEDSFGLVLLESMATGTPVVACNVGGPSEIVSHGETGLLVPPQRADAMAEAIVLLLSAMDRRRTMGLAGRRRVIEHYSARRMAEQTLQVYREVTRPQGKIPDCVPAPMAELAQSHNLSHISTLPLRKAAGNGK